MPFRKTFEFVSQEDMDKHSALIQEKQIAMFDIDEWQNWTDAQKIYDSKDYLNAAQSYFDQNPPDLIQAGEKLWGCVSFVVQKFYSQMNLSIKSHRSIRALCFFAIRFSVSSSVASKLTIGYYNAEESHKNFYHPEYTKSELEKFQSNISFFAAEFPKIKYKQVENSLLPFIKGISTTNDLEDIVFVKCNVKEKLGSEIYQANYQVK